MNNYRYNYKSAYRKAYRQGAETCDLNTDVWDPTEEQKAIIDFHRTIQPSTHAVIESGAGVGKTATAKHIVKASPYTEDCAYIVLAKRNQLEAERKIQKANWIIKTTAALGFSFLRKAWGNLRLSYTLEKDRLIECDSEIQREVSALYMAGQLVGHAKNFFIGVPSLEEMMKLARQRDCECDDKRQALGWTTEKLASLAIQVLNMSLVKSRTNEVSFGDMNWTAVSAGLVRPMFAHMVIDEAQDQSPINKELVRLSLKPNGQGTWLGDSNQAIFIFRGAIFDAMNKLKTEWKHESFKLSKTFRCGKKIVAKANQIVPEYYAHESNPDGEVIEQETKEAMETLAMPGDAILSRTNAPLMKHCLAFITKGKPANVEGKDIGKGLIRTLEDIAGESSVSTTDFCSMLDAWEQSKLAKLTGWNSAQRAEKVQDEASALRVLAEVCQTTNEMKSKILDLFTDAEERKKPVIVLSTVHKAKGLEWDRVFILQDTFTCKLQTEEQVREESNIKYVAWTRPKLRLSFVREAKASK